MASAFSPFRLLDVEVSRPLPALTDLAGHGALHVLVRLHGTPLGTVTLPVRDGQCTPETLAQAIARRHGRAILRHLVADRLASPLGGRPEPLADLLAVPHPPVTGPASPVTVAICTRDHPRRLARCLDGVRGLDHPAVEVLVVDNAPRDDATRRLLHETHPRVRYVREPEPGLDRARNRAILEASHSIIAFTDDDAVPDPGWATAVARVLDAHAEVMAVTGPVVPLVLATEAQWLFELNGGFTPTFERRWHRLDRQARECPVARFGEAGRLGTGANMAFRRSVFDAIGTFDPALDVGTPTNGGGDLDMLFRVLQAGHGLVFEPNALVRHEHRADRTALREQVANNGIGFAAYVVRSAIANPTARGAFARLWLRWILGWHVPRAVAALRGRAPVPRDLVFAELRGAFVGLTRYRRAAA